MQGTKLLFYDSHADVLLLDIPGSVPDHFNGYKIGFDAADATPNRAVAIHHPAGNIKRISYANTSCASALFAFSYEVRESLLVPHQPRAFLGGIWLSQKICW